MKTSTLIIGGGLVVGGLLLLQRLRAQQAAPPTRDLTALCGAIPDPRVQAACHAGGAACAALFSDPKDKELCFLGGPVAPIVRDVLEEVGEFAQDTYEGLTPYKDDDRANGRNGRVVKALGPEDRREITKEQPTVLGTFRWWSKEWTEHMHGGYLTSGRWKYENGCVPSNGAPGASKCLPGSVNICIDPPPGRSKADWDCSKLGTGLPGDPLTQRIGQLAKLYDRNPGRLDSIPCDNENARFIVGGVGRCLTQPLPGWPAIPGPGQRPVVAGQVTGDRGPRLPNVGDLVGGGVIADRPVVTAPPRNNTPTSPPSSPRPPRQRVS